LLRKSTSFEASRKCSQDQKHHCNKYNPRNMLSHSRLYHMRS
jgi:hypothetical protein